MSEVLGLPWFKENFDNPRELVALCEGLQPARLGGICEMIRILGFFVLERDGDRTRAMKVAEAELAIADAIPRSWTADEPGGYGRHRNLSEAHRQVAHLLRLAGDLDRALARFELAEAELLAWEAQRKALGITTLPAIDGEFGIDLRRTLYSEMADLASQLGLDARAAAYETSASEAEDNLSREGLVDQLYPRVDEAVNSGQIGSALAELRRAKVLLAFDEGSVTPRAETKLRHAHGRVLQWVGLHRSAVDLHEQCLALNQATGAVDRMAFDLRALGDAYLVRPDLGDPTPFFERSLALRSRPAERSDRARVWETLAGERFQIDHADGAEDHVLGLAQAHEAARSYSTSFQFLELAAEVAELVRGSVSQVSGRMTVLRNRHRALENTLRLCMDLTAREETPDGVRIDVAERAWAAAERSRGRTLLDELGTADLHPPAGPSEHLVTAETELQTRRAELRRRPRDAQFPWGEYDEVERRLTDVWAAISTASRAGAEYVAIRRADPVGRDGLREVVASAADESRRQVVVGSLELVGERLCWLVASSRAEDLALLPIDADAGAAQRFVRTHLGPSGDVRALALDIGEQFHGIFECLIRPLVSRTNPGDILIICPTESFQHVPFHAVRSGSTPLIARNPTCYVPSLSLLRSIRNRPTAQESGSLVVGDPTCDLSGALDEACSVASLLQAELVVGGEATVDRVHIGLQQASHVHLACHADFDPADPMESGLRLSDGTLTASALVSGPRITAGLTVLSACESGLAGHDSGEEYFGLLRSLLIAGVSTVVGTQWPVEDEAAHQVMLEFYRSLRSDDLPVLALQRAMLSSIDDLGIDRFDRWGAFVVTGDGFRVATPTVAGG